MLKVSLKKGTVEKWLVKMNISQNEFAKQFGSSSPYISQILTGKRHPSPRFRARLLEFFGKEFDDLFVIDRPVLKLKK